MFKFEMVFFFSIFEIVYRYCSVEIEMLSVEMMQFTLKLLSVAILNANLNSNQDVLLYRTYIDIGNQLAIEL